MGASLTGNQHQRNTRNSSDANSVWVELTHQDVHALMIAVGAATKEADKYIDGTHIPWAALDPVFISLYYAFGEILDHINSQNA